MILIKEKFKNKMFGLKVRSLPSFLPSFKYLVFSLIVASVSYCGVVSVNNSSSPDSPSNGSNNSGSDPNPSNNSFNNNFNNPNTSITAGGLDNYQLAGQTCKNGSYDSDLDGRKDYDLECHGNGILKKRTNFSYEAIANDYYITSENFYSDVGLLIESKSYQKISENIILVNNLVSHTTYTYTFEANKVVNSITSTNAIRNEKISLTTYNNKKRISTIAYQTINGVALKQTETFYYASNQYPEKTITYLKDGIKKASETGYYETLPTTASPGLESYLSSSWASSDTYIGYRFKYYIAYYADGTIKYKGCRKSIWGYNQSTNEGEICNLNTHGISQAIECTGTINIDTDANGTIDIIDSCSAGKLDTRTFKRADGTTNLVVKYSTIGLVLYNNRYNGAGTSIDGRYCFPTSSIPLYWEDSRGPSYASSLSNSYVGNGGGCLNY